MTVRQRPAKIRFCSKTSPFPTSPLKALAAFHPEILARRQIHVASGNVDLIFPAALAFDIVLLAHRLAPCGKGALDFAQIVLEQKRIFAGRCRTVVARRASAD